MSKRVLTLLGIVVLIAGSLAPLGVYAQSATNQPWSTSITYYTPSTTSGTLQISFYAEGSGTPINADPIQLSPHKAGSLFVGNVSGMPSTFGGAAVLSSDVPVVATAVNIASGATNDYPRPLYSGFDPSKASEDFLIPTVLYQRFGQSTLVSIQNVESSAIQATLRVYAAGSTTPSFQQTYTIQGQSAKLVAAADMGLSAGFSGSAAVEATGRVVAAAQETDDAGRGAKAFEGLAADAGATTLYMASMMCNAFGGQTTFYAIQNAGGSQASVAIDFYDKNGTKVYTATGINIGVGNKASVNPCNYTDQAAALNGINGSAVIRSTTGSVPLIAVGKISGAGLTATAFMGQSAGDTKLAVPYIRWKAVASEGWRSYVAVMNVGGGDATNIRARYYDGNGSLAATHTLASASSPLKRFTKVNTNPETAGALASNGDFGVSPIGGAIEFESDQPIVVVVRVSRETPNFAGEGVSKFAEDYNGVTIP